MICSRCKTPMREQKRAYHKKRKWWCPQCGKVIMQIRKRMDSIARRSPKS